MTTNATVVCTSHWPRPATIHDNCGEIIITGFIAEQAFRTRGKLANLDRTTTYVAHCTQTAPHADACQQRTRTERGTSTLSTQMRGFGAVIAIHRLLLASAFISRIPTTVIRSNPAYQAANRRISSNPAARRFRLLAPNAKGGDDGDERSAALRSCKPVLSFPGGGIFFWWQAGAISALQERYNLSSVDFVGASAGALAATLAACDADMDLAMTLALELCDANEVWSRPLGLAGVWGAMVEDWLEELLPENADSICRDRVHLLMLGVWPEPGKRLAVSDFSSKDDLIKSCMASVHIPYFMNQKFTALHRESRYVDGSFRASREDLSLGENQPTVYFDYEDDKVMAERRGNFLGLTNQDGLLFMRQRGYEHVQAMVADGKLDCIREAALPSPRRKVVRDR